MKIPSKETLARLSDAAGEIAATRVGGRRAYEDRYLGRKAERTMSSDIRGSYNGLPFTSKAEKSVG